MSWIVFEVAIKPSPEDDKTAELIRDRLLEAASNVVKDATISVSCTSR